MDVFDTMNRRFTSGNSVPIESTRITAEEWKQVEAIFEKLVKFLLEAPASTGVCCCGEDMENHPHPMSCGHTPRDEWDWAVECILREIGEYEKKDTSF